MPLRNMVGTVRIPLANRVETAVVLAQRGMLRPIRPDRLLQIGIALRRWGATPAGAFAVNAIARAAQVGIIDDDRSLTYREIDARTNALANELAKRGLGPGEKLAVLSRNGAGFVEAVVACAKVGADLLPLNTSFAARELDAVIARECPPVIVYDEEFEEIVRDASPTVKSRVLTGAGKETGPHRETIDGLVERGSSATPSAPAEEGRAVILTSGTTGAPKGARLGRPESIDPLAWFLKVVPIDAGSAYLIPAPLFHAHGFGQLMLGSALGCTIVLPRRFDAEQTLALIERHRVEALAVVPLMLKRIVHLPAETRRRFDTSSLKTVVSSGSALDGNLARLFMDEFGPVLYNLYGSTEMSWATIASPDDLLDAPGTAGRPPPHTRIAVLGADGRPLPPGETGRIFVGHELLFEGYTDGSPGRDTIDGMMTAGDLGHLDAEGRLFVVAREDDMIVSGGENVYPSEVEEALRAHHDVADVAVVGAEDPEFGQRPVAFVVPEQGKTLTVDELDRFARKNLARFKVPRDIVILDDLPRNALGKVLRRELRPPKTGRAR
jgi:acyl-CoA synthetase (AMP-forming)/AMP-acid ligase II